MDLKLFYTQAFGHFLVEEALTQAVRLYPFAVDDELRDRALAGPLDHLIGSAGRGFYINFPEWDVVTLQEAFGDATIRAPDGGVQYEFQAAKISFAKLCGISLRPLRLKLLNSKTAKNIQLK
ncbi:MAG: hypothetical protein ACRD20_01120 [Terriglobales bacterium]